MTCFRSIAEPAQHRQMFWLTTGALLAVAVLLLTSCAGDGDKVKPVPSPAIQLLLASQLEAAIGTVAALSQTGVIPDEGTAFVDASLAYGGKACGILTDTTLDPAAKQTALATDLIGERAAFEAAFRDLLHSHIDKATLVAVAIAMNQVRAAVRVLLTSPDVVDPAVYGPPCASVARLAASWAAEKPA